MTPRRKAKPKELRGLVVEKFGPAGSSHYSLFRGRLFLGSMPETMFNLLFELEKNEQEQTDERSVSSNDRKVDSQ